MAMAAIEPGATYGFFGVARRVGIISEVEHWWFFQNRRFLAWSVEVRDITVVAVLQNIIIIKNKNQSFHVSVLRHFPNSLLRSILSLCREFRRKSSLKGFNDAKFPMALRFPFHTVTLQETSHSVVPVKWIMDLEELFSVILHGSNQILKM